MRRERVPFADAGLFMGMHSGAEPVRIACKAFFVRHLGTRLVMTLDQVGLCDDIVWRHPRHVQDLYYPFMDRLHTLLCAERVAYTCEDIRRAAEDPALRDLEGSKALLVARVCNEDGTLYTTDRTLLDRAGFPVSAVELGPELAFPEPIESAYRTSLALRLPPQWGVKTRTQCCAE